MECMEQMTQTPTPARPISTADVLTRAGIEDLNYLAAIGLAALVAQQAAGDDSISGGDYLQHVGQSIQDASAHAARPAFLPSEKETAETDGAVWRERFDFRLWAID